MTTNLIAMPTLENLGGKEIKMRRTLPMERPGWVPAEIILAHLPHNRITPFATWQRNTDEFEGTYWGHYFRAGEEEKAVKDFMTRGR
jgi:hypothetical protein